tara:strand:+ start:72 stop:287 length:216 start_codon:yes stop_codon:yes gene_type:complete
MEFMSSRVKYFSLLGQSLRFRSIREHAKYCEETITEQYEQIKYLQSELEKMKRRVDMKDLKLASLYMKAVK